jgi:hypothetical protein
LGIRPDAETQHHPEKGHYPPFRSLAFSVRALAAAPDPILDAQQEDIDYAVDTLLLSRSPMGGEEAGQ